MLSKMSFWLTWLSYKNTIKKCIGKYLISCHTFVLLLVVQSISDLISLVLAHVFRFNRTQFTGSHLSIFITRVNSTVIHIHMYIRCMCRCPFCMFNPVCNWFLAQDPSTCYPYTRISQTWCLTWESPCWASVKARKLIFRWTSRWWSSQRNPVVRLAFYVCITIVPLLLATF